MQSLNQIAPLTSMGPDPNASTQRLLSDIAAQQYLNLNSLSLPVQNGSTGLAVRLGANQVGDHFEMVPKTHSVTLVLLVPKEYVAQGSSSFEVAIKGRAYYRDPEAPENAPISRTAKGTDIQFSVFPLRLSETVACPPAQAILAQVVTLAKSSKVTNLTINGASSLLYRRVRATLNVKQTIGRETFSFLSPEAAHADDSLTFTFPDISLISKRTASVDVEVLRSLSGDEPALTCGKASEYPVVFPRSEPATGSKKATTKAKKALKAA